MPVEPHGSLRALSEYRKYASTEAPLRIWRAGTVAVEAPVGSNPWSKVSVPVKPLLHVSVTLPVAFNGLDAFATIGS
jgi:hypothetical protein